MNAWRKFFFVHTEKAVFPQVSAQLWRQQFFYPQTVPTGCAQAGGTSPQAYPQGRRPVGLVPAGSGDNVAGDRALDTEIRSSAARKRLRRKAAPSPRCRTAGGINRRSRMAAKCRSRLMQHLTVGAPARPASPQRHSGHHGHHNTGYAPAARIPPRHTMKDGSFVSYASGLGRGHPGIRRQPQAAAGHSRRTVRAGRHDAVQGCHCRRRRNPARPGLLPSGPRDRSTKPSSTSTAAVSPPTPSPSPMN